MDYTTNTVLSPNVGKASSVSNCSSQASISLDPLQFPTDQQITVTDLMQDAMV